MKKKEFLDTLEELFTDAYVCDRHCEHVLNQREVLNRIKAAQQIVTRHGQATPKFENWVKLMNKIFAVFLNVFTDEGEGLFATTKERDELAKALKEAGKTGYAKSDPGAWKRHVKAMDQPQPKEWREPNSE